MRNRILIVGAFRFPNGDAAAARVLGLGKSLRQGGLDVAFAGWEQTGRADDSDGEGNFFYEGFQYFSQGEFRTVQLSPIRRLVRYLFAGSNTLKWLSSIATKDVKAVIVYHGGSVFLVRLLFFCKLRNIKLVADCTEWYDPEGLVGGRFGVAHLDNEFRMRLINPLIGRLIVISSFLQRYYRTRFCDVLCIPPTIDLNQSKWDLALSQHRGNAVSLVYAGVPGKKDLLAAVLYGMRILRTENIPVVLNLVGPSQADLLVCVDGNSQLLDDLNGSLVFHGRVPQEVVPKIVTQSDFSILLRPVKRVSAAGFSTKLVESLAAGVPVIANRTGDIDCFVKDGVEGILLAEGTTNEFVAAIRRASKMSVQELTHMKQAARLCAKNSFAYENYSAALAKFIIS